MESPHRHDRVQARPEETFPVTTSQPGLPGDLVRAFGGLAPKDDATRKAIAQALRVDWLPETTLAEAPPAPPPKPSPPPVETTEKPERGEYRSPTVTRGGDRPREEPTLKAMLRPIYQPAPTLPAWLEAVRPLTAESDREPAVLSLFPPKRARGVLTCALARSSPHGEIDLERVVRAVARGEALTEIPRRSIPTLARGVRLYVDQGPAMLPFRRDLEQLEQAIRAVVGGVGLRVLSFSEFPGRQRRTLAPDEPDSALGPPIQGGESVIVATDLGAGQRPGHGRPAAAEEWLGFNRWVRASGSLMLAIVPYGRNRYPEELRRSVALLHWDPRTTAYQAAQAVRRWLKP